MSVEDTLRKAIVDSGQSLRKLSMSTGMERVIIRNFLTGKGTLYLSTADKLAAHLGLELGPAVDKTVKGTKRRKGRGV